NGAAFALQLAAGVVVVKGGTLGIGETDANRRIALLEISAHPRQGTAGAHRADKTINFAFCLLPDFSASGVVVNLRIGGIVKLASPDCAMGFRGGEFFRHAPGGVNIMLGIVVTG